MSVSAFFRSLDFEDMSRLTRRDVSHYDCENGKVYPRDYEAIAQDDEELKRRPPRLRQHSRCAWACRVACLLLVVAMSVGATIVTQTLMHGGSGGGGGFLIGAGPHSGSAYGQQTSTPLPASLRRFQLIKRAEYPEQGAEAESMRRLFPHWRLSDVGSPTVRDLTLAISQLVSRLVEQNA